MREIKFKAQRLDGKGWVVGHYTTAEDCVYKSISHYIIVKGVISYGVQWERYTVNPDTVCQFTGLLDKDGKEIFEGDIIDTEKAPMRVVYKDGCFYSESESMYRLGGWSIESIQVIGNTHDK